MKTYLKTTFFLGLMLLLMAACETNNTPNTDEMKKIIEEQNLKFSKAIQTADVKMIAELYTDDARLSPPGEDFTDGKENIMKWWQGGFEYGLKDIKMVTTSLKGNGVIWYETGKVEVLLTIKDNNGADATTSEFDKYTNVWVKQADGSYKLAVHSWNGDMEKMDELQ